MKILTILGTRPEIIRLCRIIAKLDALELDHVLVHTGQNYDYELDTVFFEQLGVRKPDHYLGARGSFAKQLAVISERMEAIFTEERPDRFLVLGDTNSSLSAIVAKRMGIPVFHMEAGNRCHDFRVPEEVNRRIIDHCSDILLPYSERSREYLLKEGFSSERVYVTGNPINEVLTHFAPQIDGSSACKTLGVEPHQYFLVTAHRQENVDDPGRLAQLAASLVELHRLYGYPVIVSTHPRTKKRLEQFDIKMATDGIRFMKPFGFFDFVKLQKSAFCVLSDSGTVQEESTILGVPGVTLRDSTERPETLECGGAIVCGVSIDAVVRSVQLVRAIADSGTAWPVPREYQRTNVSDTVIRLLLGHFRHATAGVPATPQ